MRTEIHDRLLPGDVEVESLFSPSMSEFVPLEGLGRDDPAYRDDPSQRADTLLDHSFVLALGDHDEIIGAMAYVSREECAYVAAVAVVPTADRDEAIGAMFGRLEVMLVSEAGRSTLCIGIWSTHLSMRKLMADLGFSLFSFDLDRVNEGVDAMIFHRRKAAPQGALTTH